MKVVPIHEVEVLLQQERKLRGGSANNADPLCHFGLSHRLMCCPKKCECVYLILPRVVYMFAFRSLSLTHTQCHTTTNTHTRTGKRCGGKGCAHRPGGRNACCASGAPFAAVQLHTNAKTSSSCEHNVAPCLMTDHALAHAIKLHAFHEWDGEHDAETVLQHADSAIVLPRGVSSATHGMHAAKPIRSRTRGAGSSRYLFRETV